MLKLYLASLCVAIFLAQSSHAALLPLSVKFSTNVSEIEVGKPFIATCDIGNFFFGGSFEFDFKFNNQLLATFYANSSSNYLYPKFFSANASNFSTTKNAQSFHYTDDSKLYLSGQCSIALTLQTRQTPGTFWCETRGTAYKPAYVELSNKWSPAAVKGGIVQKGPSLAFSTNVTKVASGKPFTASCVVSGFDAENKNYVVKFWRTSGLLGAYEVKAPTQQHPKSHTMFIIETDLATVTVHDGVHYAYPTFEVQLVPRSDVSENYWCQLEVGNASNKSQQYRSNLWPNVATVVFSTSVRADKSRLGRCSMSDNFALEGRKYSVKFFANSKQLASYELKPNHPQNFIVHDNGLKVVHGENVDFPNFEIAFTEPNVLSGNYWCVFKIGEQGQAGFGEFKSNEIHL